MKRMLTRGMVLTLVCCLIGPLLGSAGLPSKEKPKAVSAEDWKNAQGQPAGDKDLRLATGGHYYGGYDRAWWLVITGPPAGKFHYGSLTIPGQGIEVVGTYAIKDGLAWFSGTQWLGASLPGEQVNKNDPGVPLRFALNYRHLDGETFFNLLCKNGKGEYEYERKWFAPMLDEWKLQEHHKLTFILKEKSDKQLKFLVKGELTRWNGEANKLVVQPIDVTAAYTLAEKQGVVQEYWYGKDAPAWLPLVLRPHGAKASAKEPPACFHLDSGYYYGAAHGFSTNGPPKAKSK